MTKQSSQMELIREVKILRRRLKRYENMYGRAKAFSKTGCTVASPLLENHGVIHHSTSSPKQSEIVEHLLGQEPLKESQERLRLFIEHAPAALAMFDRDMCYLAVSRRWISDYHLHQCDLIGKCYYEISPETSDSLKAVHRQCVDGKTVKGDTERFERSDGSIQWLRWEMRPWKATNGRIGGIVIFSEDITEYKRIEASLREGEKRLVLAKNTARLGVYDHDIIHDTILWDERIRELWGVGPNDSITYDVFMNGLHPDDRTSTQTSVDLAFDPSGRGEYFAEYRVVNQVDGQERWIAATGQVSFLEGHAIRNVGTVQDITERKQAEQKIQEYQSRLRALAAKLTETEEREREQLAERLHDDVSQCLAFCKMKLEILRQKTTNSAHAAELAHVCNTLTGLLADTQDMTFELSSPILKVLGFKAALVSWLREEIEEKHDIRTEFQSDVPSISLHEPLKTLLFRSTRELLTNAIKHANARNLRVIISHEPNHFIIRVEDDGQGFILNEGPSSKTQGFGLFSIEERLADLGGSLEIDTAPGRGCRVTLRVPLNQQSPVF